MATKAAQNPIIALTPEEFYDIESEEWKLLSDNRNHLSDAIDNERQILDLASDVWEVYVRLLDYRKGSLSAKVDATSLAERPCFLCADNRPKEQGVMEWENYEILVNPYPVGDYHFTIASNKHEPQRILGRIKDMARISRLMPDNCVFYNGPLCGASAPDHFHFQGIQGSLSLNIHIPLDKLTEVVKFGKSRVYRSNPDNSLFPYLIINSATDKELVEIFDKIYAALPPAEPEPMMNIVMFKDNSRIRTMIVPRKRHRPLCYGTGEGQMLISPASIEMLGTFVPPRKEDFERLDGETVKQIYREVTLEPEEFEAVIEKLKQ